MLEVHCDRQSAPYHPSPGAQTSQFAGSPVSRKTLPVFFHTPYKTCPFACALIPRCPDLTKVPRYSTTRSAPER